MAGNTKRTRDDKRRAAVAFMVSGSFERAAIETGLPSTTIRTWRDRDEDFRQFLAAAETEFGEEMRAQFGEVVSKATEGVMDRIRHGDVVVDPKTGVPSRVPMRGRDLTLCAAIFFDKLRIADGRPTRITAQVPDLAALAASFASLAQGQGERGLVAVQGEQRDG
jgi:hypothetical protein